MTLEEATKRDGWLTQGPTAGKVAEPRLQGGCPGLHWGAKLLLLLYGRCNHTGYSRKKFFCPAWASSQGLEQMQRDRPAGPRKRLLCGEGPGCRRLCCGSCFLPRPVLRGSRCSGLRPREGVPSGLHGQLCWGFSHAAAFAEAPAPTLVHSQ